MNEVRSIIQKLKAIMPVLSKKYCVKSLEIFGSYVRGSQKEGSDIDILVEFSDTIDLFEFIALENYLSDRIGLKVDLVMKDTVKPRIRERIFKEAVPV